MQELTDLAEDNVELNFDAVFRRGLYDEDPDVRAGSIRGLWEHEGSDIVDPLLSLLEMDASEEVRAEAALSLGRFVLLAEEGNLRESVFERIDAALRRVIESASETLEVRRRALESIAAHDSPWVRQAIREAYEGGVHPMKVSALHAMGRSCEERWLPLLVREFSSEEAELRYEAAIACGAVGDARAVPHLARLARDPDEEVRKANIFALGEIGGQEARTVLNEVAVSGSKETRAAALDALAEMAFDEDPLSIRNLM